MYRRLETSGGDVAVLKPECLTGFVMYRTRGKAVICGLNVARGASCEPEECGAGSQDSIPMRASVMYVSSRAGVCLKLIADQKICLNWAERIRSGHSGGFDGETAVR